MRVTRKSRISLGIAAFLVLVAAWVGYANLDPVLSIPPPAPRPSPNAYDQLNQALDMGFKEPTKMKHYDPSDPLAQREQLVVANAPMFARFRKAMAYPFMWPEQPRIMGSARCAKLFRIEGSVLADHGDIRGAIASNLDNIHYGVVTTNGATLIPSLIATVVEQIGQVDLWVYLARCDVGTAKATAKRLEHLAAQRVSMVEVLVNEKHQTQRRLMDGFRNPKYPWYGNCLYSVWAGSRRGAMHSLTQYFDRQIAEARKPFCQQQPGKFSPNQLTRIFQIVQGSWTLRSHNAATQTALLTTAFALRAYRLEHGAYTASLDALTPGYLTAIPADPFADAGPLRYKKTATGYTLYSVGPDGKDEGGLPCKEGRPTQDRSRLVPNPLRKTSTGDIVAGVNV